MSEKRPVRYCVDCNRIISDKRFKWSSQGRRCKDCQKKYRRQYRSGWFQRNKDRIRFKKKKKAGTLADRYTRKRMENYVTRHKIYSRHMIKIKLGGGKLGFVYDVGEEKLEKLKRKYGAENVIILPSTRPA